MNLIIMHVGHTNVAITGWMLVILFVFGGVGIFGGRS